MRYNYNRQLTPPAPFVHVRVAGPGIADAGEETAAQLDSAADRTVIPWAVVESLQLPQLDELPVLGFGGHLSSVPTFLVQLGAPRTWELPGLSLVLIGQAEPGCRPTRDC